MSPADVAALRAAATDALTELVDLSARAVWGDVADDVVDRAAALYTELQGAYFAARDALTTNGAAA